MVILEKLLLITSANAESIANDASFNRKNRSIFLNWGVECSKHIKRNLYFAQDGSISVEIFRQ